MDWTNRKEQTVQKVTQVLRAVRDNEARSYQELADLTGVGYSSIQNYAGEETQLLRCMAKENEVYHLTPLGRAALDVSWSTVFYALES